VANRLMEKIVRRWVRQSREPEKWGLMKTRNGELVRTFLSGSFGAYCLEPCVLALRGFSYSSSSECRLSFEIAAGRGPAEHRQC
jgi:hypothetical protein